MTKCMVKKRMKTPVLKLGVGVVLALVAKTVMAAPIFFSNDPVSDRTLFQGAAGPLTLESFETNWSGASSVPFPVGSPQEFLASVSVGTLNQSSFSRGITDGSFSMGISENPQNNVITFAFDSPITAFGLDVNDLNFVNMSFSDNLGNVLSNILLGDQCGPAGGPSCQNLQFFGVVNNQAFTTVTLTFTNFTGQSGTIFLDRLEYAKVSEPVSLALLGIGLAGLGFARKKKAR